LPYVKISSTFRLNIFLVIQTLPLEQVLSLNVLAPGYAMAMLEAAVVCFTDQQHQSGLTLPVKLAEPGSNRELQVSWVLEISDNIRKSYQEPSRTTDYGAMCVAVLLSTILVENCNAVEPTVGNNGFDFYLCDEEDTYNFYLARLEVSGIRKESKTNTVEKRVEIKKQQTQRSDNSGLPAYICVTEFGTPKASYIKK
jgi:hypothetical protein